MNHSGFSIRTHLIELPVKCLVLNRGLTGVWLSFGFRLCCISRYRVWVML